MAERGNPPPTRNNRPSRGMIATHVEKLRAMAAQLLREARRLTGEGPDDAVGGWSAERAATASFGRIRASPTAWALFERGFAEGRRSTRETTPQAGARTRAGPPGRVPPRRAVPAYQRHDVRDRQGRFQRQGQQPAPQAPPSAAPVPQQPPAQPLQPLQPPSVQPKPPTPTPPTQPAQPPVIPPIQPAQPPATPEAQLAVVERWIEEMEVTAEADADS
ncbi:WAS/WASL-interacting protein family member 3-like [Aphis gossypii]|uniref:WAS/WASL-interacting protein family member 3-like n=1 Tax=Aphis gossypii TaxID=80765 RepID=UPI0021598A05|nr:WAS/WASL-interacting protein family member 3-like [Aphis gossypii]